MQHRRHRRARGNALVEFSIVLPALLLVIFGMVDFGRAIQADTAVAEAARQGARQASANAATGDQPFGTYANGACSGTVFAANASGVGCLTDAAILQTVKSNLAGVTNNVTQSTASPCPSPTTAGAAIVCINPAQSGSPDATDANCNTAAVRLGHDARPGDLGTRAEEWQAPKFQKGRCFLVQVTVNYAFAPWTPLVRTAIGSAVQISSSTATLAEY